MKIVKSQLFSQLLATLTAFLTIFLSGLWLSWVSAVLPKFKAGQIDIPLSENDVTWMVALMDLGNLLSPIPSGYIMDRMGRIPTLRLSALTYGVASALALTASTPQHLWFARLFAGIGKGIGYTVAPMYVGEIAGPKIRGALSGIFIIMLTGGSACSMTFGPFITFTTLNWATLIFPVLILLLSLFVPESPYYHFMQGDEASAKSAFNRLRGHSASASPEDNPELLAIQKKVEADMAQPTTFKTLFTGKGNRRALKITLATSAFQRLGGISCIFAYASTTLPEPEGSFWDPRTTLIVFGWSGVLAGILATTLIDTFGRKPLLLISTLTLSLLMGESALFYYFDRETSYDFSLYTFMPHIGIMLFGVFYPVGIGQVPHTLQSELLPTNVKSQASALSTIVLSICSFATNKMYLPVAHHIGVYAMFLVFSLSNLCCFIFALFFVFETKGKTLGEIQLMLGNN